MSPELYREVNGPQSFDCPICHHRTPEGEGYQFGNVSICPCCRSELPAALMELTDDGSGKIVAKVDAWSAGKEEADHWCDDHGFAVTHSISDEAAKALEAEAEDLAAWKANREAAIERDFKKTKFIHIS